MGQNLLNKIPLAEEIVTAASDLTFARNGTANPSQVFMVMADAAAFLMLSAMPDPTDTKNAEALIKDFTESMMASHIATRDVFLSDVEQEETIH